MTLVDDLIAALSQDEKVLLVSGEDIMSTPAIDRLGIPKIRVSDGPSGARGASLPSSGGAPSSCIPCGAALGATWDPGLVEQLARLVGGEARTRGCRGLLAPTVNLHRSPLAGRNFECYSEDPFLSGKLGAAYVRGVQREGVFAAIKHFVANEAEFERGTIDSVVDERALRELYFVPFEMAVKEAGVLAVMTAYNRLNGRWLTENREILGDVLRAEWGFDGLVMTDWFAAVNTTTSLGAGLDLEMPGPARAFGPKLTAALADGIVEEADLDRAVRALLTTYDRIGALDAPTPAPEPVTQSDEDRALLRTAAGRSIVLLKNDGVLPLRPESLQSVAVIGPRAFRGTIVGGGSAEMTTFPIAHLVDVLPGALGDGVHIVRERGCTPDTRSEVVGSGMLTSPAGFQVEWFANSSFDGTAVERSHLSELKTVLYGVDPGALAKRGWSMRATGSVVASETVACEVVLSQVGHARLFLDGAAVLDGIDHAPAPTPNHFGIPSAELAVALDLIEGSRHDIVLEYVFDSGGMGSVTVGVRPTDEEALMRRAVAAAERADLAIVAVGTSEEWEAEGSDRTTMRLPGRQDELVRAVAAVNPRTVVVVNAGGPVELSWADDVAAVVLSWFGGQEMAGGIVDVLTGAADPGGRLPTSWPELLEHNPSHDNFPGENGVVRYGEGLFVGYRGYEHRRIRPRFPFGHGLSYTSFEIGTPELDRTVFHEGERLQVRVPVANTGGRAGSTVVQCYVAPGTPRLSRPLKELKAFARVDLDPGVSTVVGLTLDERSFSYWDPGQVDWPDIRARSFAMFQQPEVERREPGWQLDAGHYELHIGLSTADIHHFVHVEVRDSCAPALQDGSPR